MYLLFHQRFTQKVIIIFIDIFMNLIQTTLFIQITPPFCQDMHFEVKCLGKRDRSELGFERQIFVYASVNFLAILYIAAKIYLAYLKYLLLQNSRTLKP